MVALRRKESTRGIGLTITSVCLLLGLAICNGAPQVRISQGIVEGIYQKTSHGRKVASFLGIPYAQPPVGELRFRSPLPAKNWAGVFKATKDPPICAQVTHKKAITLEEDCLFLSVHTPQLPVNKTSKLLPVIVWIHGGFFRNGGINSNTTSPGYLLNHDVVLVNVAYRLGPLGFLSTGDKNSPGNYGLKDQVLSLHWVRQNIAEFGGNPNSVTIAGQSAGSASVHLLSLSNLTEGLFHRMIMESGVASSTWGYQSKTASKLVALTLSMGVGCNAFSNTALVDCLRKTKVATILNIAKKANLLFGPTSEPEGDGAFLTEEPSAVLERGGMRDVPWINGINREDGLVVTYPLFFDQTLLTKVVGSVGEFLYGFVQLFLGIIKYNANILNIVSDMYFASNASESNTFVNSWTAFCTDYGFVYPTIDLIKKQTNIGRSKCYLYTFDYTGTFSFIYPWSSYNKHLGVCHQDETIYLFPQANTVFKDLNQCMSARDLIMVEKLTGLWASFATTGVPRLPKKVADDTDDTWIDFKSGNEGYLQIGNSSETSLTMKSHLKFASVNFWTNLYSNA